MENMENKKFRSSSIKRMIEAMKKNGKIDKESIQTAKAEALRKRTEELIKKGFPHRMAVDFAKGEMMEREARVDLQLRNIPLATGEHNINGAVVGYYAGAKVGNAASISEEYGETTYYAERKNRGREYAETHMAEWIQIGEELVYPEKIEEWRKNVENSTESPFYGLDIANAIEIMRVLDTEAEVKDVVESFMDKEHCGGGVEKLVLNFSKRGPEYMEQFMSTLGKELTPQIRAKLETLKTENMQYAENELARNRETKENKTEELARASSELDELSVENKGKDSNQVVQE